MLLEGALILWFVLTGFSLIYMLYALKYNTPEPGVMKWAWFLVILYTGPFGLFIYLLSCREPFPGTHELFVAARWKQSVGSEIHCLAGDATGIIIAAFAVSFFTISGGTEMFIEYVAGFISGLFIFQALFMKDMMGGSYWKALKGTFMSEWLSMNVIMAGMLAVMFLWRQYQPSAADPATLAFWGSMSLATIVGGILAYPINDWLVTNNLKHGMGTVRKPGDPVMQLVPAETHAGHGGHDHHAMAATPSTAKMTWVTILTLVVLALGVAVGLMG